jgi:hypothetical protein
MEAMEGFLKVMEGFLKVMKGFLKVTEGIPKGVVFTGLNLTKKLSTLACIPLLQPPPPPQLLHVTAYPLSTNTNIPLSWGQHLSLQKDFAPQVASHYKHHYYIISSLCKGNPNSLGESVSLKG